VRKVLENTEGNGSRTARILQISQKTVMRARNGILNNIPRRPLHSPRGIDARSEYLIVFEGKQTTSAEQQLSAFLFQPYGHEFSIWFALEIQK
jgi:hypothetical protein